MTSRLLAVHRDCYIDAAGETRLERAVEHPDHIWTDGDGMPCYCVGLVSVLMNGMWSRERQTRAEREAGL